MIDRMVSSGEQRANRVFPDGVHALRVGGLPRRVDS